MASLREPGQEVSRSPTFALATKQELLGLGALSLVWEDLLAKLRATDAGLLALGEKFLGTPFRKAGPG